LKGRIFTTSIEQGEQAQTWVMKRMQDNFFVYSIFLEEEEIECVRGELIIMCEKMLFMETNGV
jgi:hypothetical protein